MKHSKLSECTLRTLLGIAGTKQVVGPMVNGDFVQLTNQSSQFIFNGGKNAYFLLFTSYDPYSSAALSLVKQLRSENPQFLVGGLTSSVIDLQNYYSTAYTQLEIIIVAIIAVVLGISFRSIRYPFISLSGVFISITWTTGIVYAISKYLLGQDLVFLIPVVLYVILTSLGNDFTVFILSRVKEEQQKFGFEEGLARAYGGIWRSRHGTWSDSCSFSWFPCIGALWILRANWDRVCRLPSARYFRNKDVLLPIYDFPAQG